MLLGSGCGGKQVVHWGHYYKTSIRLKNKRLADMQSRVPQGTLLWFMCNINRTQTQTVLSALQCIATAKKKNHSPCEVKDQIQHQMIK